MLKKCNETDEDPYLALLDIRNTPRDGQIGSPVQRLMGRRTRTRLPTSERLLQPDGKSPYTVQRQLQAYRERQKHYYDRGTKPEPTIDGKDAIRTLTPQGWKPAEFVQKHHTPNSYIIKAGDQARTFRKNRKEPMVTKETPHMIRAKPNTPTMRPPQNPTQMKRRALPTQPPTANNPQAIPTPMRRRESPTQPRGHMSVTIRTANKTQHQQDLVERANHQAISKTMFQNKQLSSTLYIIWCNLTYLLIMPSFCLLKTRGRNG